MPKAEDERRSGWRVAVTDKGKPPNDPSAEFFIARVLGRTDAEDAVRMQFRIPRDLKDVTAYTEVYPDVTEGRQMAPGDVQRFLPVA